MKYGPRVRQCDSCLSLVRRIVKRRDRKTRSEAVNLPSFSLSIFSVTSRDADL